MLEAPERLITAPAAVAGTLIPRLRNHFSEEQVVEILFWSAIKTATMRLAYSWGLEHEYDDA